MSRTLNTLIRFVRMSMWLCNPRRQTATHDQLQDYCLPVCSADCTNRMRLRTYVWRVIVDPYGNADRIGAIMDLTVRDIMRTDVQTIGPRHSLAKLQKILISEDVGGLPVVESGQLLGIASRSDIVQRLQSERVQAMRKIGLPPEIHLTAEDASDLGDAIGESLEKVRVEQIMKRDIVSVSPDATIQQAAELLTTQHIHRLPVVENDHLIGLVSSYDIIGLIANGTLKQVNKD